MCIWLLCVLCSKPHVVLLLPGAAGKAPRSAQEYYSVPAVRHGAAPTRADHEGMSSAAETESDGWGGVPDPSETAQLQSEANLFVPPRPLDHIQQRQLNAVAQKAGLTNQAQNRMPQGNPMPQQRPVQTRAAPAPPSTWTCPTCTYEHKKDQAGFLACAVCGSVRK